MQPRIMDETTIDPGEAMVDAVLDAEEERIARAVLGGANERGEPG